MILDCDVDFQFPIIPRRPLQSTGRALVHMEEGKMKLKLNNKEQNFNIYSSMKHIGEIQNLSVISTWL